MLFNISFSINIEFLKIIHINKNVLFFRKKKHIYPIEFGLKKT